MVSRMGAEVFMRLLIIASLLSAIVQAVLIIAAFTQCLPDTPDRFFMGRGSMGQCLYAEGNAVGEVLE